MAAAIFPVIALLAFHEHFDRTFFPSGGELDFTSEESLFQQSQRHFRHQQKLADWFLVLGVATAALSALSAGVYARLRNVRWSITVCLGLSIFVAVAGIGQIAGLSWTFDEIITCPETRRSDLETIWVCMPF